MPVFDSSLMFRTTGNLTQNESKGPVTVRTTGIQGLAVRVVVPAGTYGASDTILPRVWASDDNSTYSLAASYENGAQTVGAGGKEMIVPIVAEAKYLKLELLLTATTTNFGAVVAGLVQGVGYDWTRAVDWS